MIIKALAAMPGIGFRGETCGAVTGALAALSISSGRDKLGDPGDADFESYLGLIRASIAFCHAFEKEFGSLMCSHIQTQLLGRTFDASDPAEIQAMVQAGGPQKCRIPTGKAARFAAEIILEEESRS